MNRFTNKNVVISGGTRGIGLCITRQFLREGANVVLVSKNQENGEKVLSELKKEFTNDLSFYSCDLKDHEKVKEFSSFVIEKFSSVDILVNNAGISKNCLFIKADEQHWDHVVDTNLKSVYNMTYAFSRNLIKNRGAKIVNISSIAGGVTGGNPGLAAYAASKGAIVSLTKCLAREFAKRGVCVNCVAPGYTETEMVSFLDSENKKLVEDMIPLRRFAKPEEIANSVAFLASDQASYITGHTLVVDGGLTS